MLLFIDFSVLEIFENKQPDPRMLAAIEHIADSRKSGKHAVLGDRATIRGLAKNKNLSARVRAIYAKIYEGLPTQRAYVEHAKVFVKVLSGERFEKVIDNDREVLYVPLAQFEEFELLARTVLLVENRDDASFYRRLSNAYISWNNIGQGVRVNFDPRGGGGQNTSDEFEGLQSSGDRFCLCIVDSDKRSPKHEFGGTAKSVVKSNDCSKILCCYVVLNVRMIENLVPLEVYKEIFKDDINKKKALHLLETLVSQNEEALLYIHPKQTLKLFKVLKEEKTKPFRQYWTDFSTKYRSSECGKCLELEQCMTPNSCSCTVTLGFGKEVIPLVEEKYKGIDFAHLVDEYIKPEWLRIGGLITFWCLASPKLSSIGG